MTFETLCARSSQAPDSQGNLLTDGVLSCTYADLPALFRQVAHYFNEAGVTPAECVAVECLNSLPAAITILYLLQQGYHLMLMPYHPPQDNITNTIPVFCQTHLTIRKAPVVASASSVFQPAEVITITPRANAQVLPDHLRQSGPHLYLRTSGSMGGSKIVVHPHAQFIENVLNCQQHYHLSAHDRLTIPVPIFHMYGLGAAFLPAFAGGAAINLQHQTNLIKYLDHEQRFQPNVAFMTPALCEMLLRTRQTPGGYRLVVTSGDKIQDTVFRAFDAQVAPIVNQYGSTEMGAIAACVPEDALEVRATTIGRPMRGVELRVDFANQVDQARGQLWCRHAYGFASYIDDQGQRVGTVTAAEWFATGDLVERQPQGALKVLGRCDNSINRSGRLVLFADLEKALEQLPAIAQAVVVALPGEGSRGQRMAATCLLRQGVAATAAQIQDACFTVLPKHAIPEIIQIVSQFPSLPSGKVDRQGLIQLLTRAEQPAPTEEKRT